MLYIADTAFGALHTASKYEVGKCACCDTKLGSAFAF